MIQHAFVQNVMPYAGLWNVITDIYREPAFVLKKPLVKNICIARIVEEEGQGLLFYLINAMRVFAKFVKKKLVPITSVTCVP